MRIAASTLQEWVKSEYHIGIAEVAYVSNQGCPTNAKFLIGSDEV